MSLYNRIFGENKDADILLGVLGLNKSTFERYRDICLNSEGDIIIVYTRCGGGNRKEYKEMFEKIKKHPNYITDYDDSFDHTYAYIEFSVPDKYKDMCKSISPDKDPMSVSEKFDEECRKMAENPEGPEMQKALSIFGPIINSINESNSDDNDDKPNIKFFGI